MNRVRAFFIEEATECLAAARRALSGSTPDPGAVYGAVRRLRGSAQVARFGGLAETARSLEESLRPVARGEAGWDEALGTRVAAGVESLSRDVDAVREGRVEQDEREPAMDEQARNEAGTGEVVPIETLEYQGDSALAKAQELREPLESAIVSGDPPGAIIDELFELIRLGTK